VAPYLDRACVTLLPLRHGAGTKRKLIQAAMAGTPSVSTEIGIEGLPLHDNEHVLVADDPAAFADRIARLVDDEALWTRLADAGRRAALAAHGRDVVRARFNEIVAP
jgi:glycosyltransferase involved in cell wall biosynthesis